MFLSVTDHDKRHVVFVARKLFRYGFQARRDCGHGLTYDRSRGNECRAKVYKVKEGRPSVVDFIKGQRIQLVS